MCDIFAHMWYICAPRGISGWLICWHPLGVYPFIFTVMAFLMKWFAGRRFSQLHFYMWWARRDDETWWGTGEEVLLLGYVLWCGELLPWYVIPIRSKIRLRILARLLDNSKQPTFFRAVTKKCKITNCVVARLTKFPLVAPCLFCLTPFETTKEKRTSLHKVDRVKIPRNFTHA